MTESPNDVGCSATRCTRTIPAAAALAMPTVRCPLHQLVAAIAVRLQPVDRPVWSLAYGDPRRLRDDLRRQGWIR